MNNPTVVEAVVQIRAPAPAGDLQVDEDFGFDFPEVIEAEDGQDDDDVDDPVASGGDASTYAHGSTGSVDVENIGPEEQ